MEVRFPSLFILRLVSGADLPTLFACLLFSLNDVFFRTRDASREWTGLLVAACVNRAPEGLLGAAVADVGVLDLLKVIFLPRHTVFLSAR